MSRETLKLALDALETSMYPQQKQLQAITALREALAEQPAQPEPVVWMYQDKSTHEVKFQKHMRGFVDHGATYETPLYTSPPAQRTWVSLTDEELSEVYNQADWDTVSGWEYERAIEAKLRSKNEDRN